MKLVFVSIVFITQASWAYDTAYFIKDRITLSAGTFHTCAVHGDEEITCWGDNSEGQATPPRINKIRQLASGDYHTCALHGENDVTCWGKNNRGQLNVPKLSQVKQLSAARDHTCALHGDSKISCWGHSQQATLMNPPKLFEVERITTGDLHGCALHKNRDVSCWGNSLMTENRKLRNVREISASWSATCALYEGNDLECWGLIGAFKSERAPKLLGAKQLSSGAHHFCTLDSEGKPSCWYYGYKPLPNLSPKEFSQFETFASGGFHLCGVNADNEVMCWGDDAHGQLSVPEVFLHSAVRFLTLNQDLLNLGKYLYPHKATFAREVAKVINELNPTKDRTKPSVPLDSKAYARLLAFNLIEPVLKSTETRFIQERVFPKYLKEKHLWNLKANVRTNQDIHCSTHALDVSLELTMNALKVSKPLFSEQATKSSLNPLIQALAEIKALAAPTPNIVLAVLNDEKEAIDALLSNPSTQGFGEMILEIKAYLEAQ